MNNFFNDDHSCPDIVTEQYLDANPDHIFVFGDNWARIGKGGAAKLRDHPQTYGFVTKKYPNNNYASFFTVHEYEEVFHKEITKFKNYMRAHPDKRFIVSKVGGLLANKFGIFEAIIAPRMKQLLTDFNNQIIWLW